jgi:hypothetical protein
MLITRKSSFTGVEHTLEIAVTQEQLDNWENGELIQKAMPKLTPDEREFIMTGITAAEWQQAFGESE